MSYCDRDDIGDIFGVENVTHYADSDNDGDTTKITNRVNRAISAAEEEVNSFMRGTHYRIPLVTADSATPATISNLTAHLAGLGLYEAHGVVDVDSQGKPVHRLYFLRQWTDTVIKGLLAGTRQLDAV